MHSERIHRGLATALAIECNEIKLPCKRKIPFGLAAEFFISKIRGLIKEIDRMVCSLCQFWER